MLAEHQQHPYQKNLSLIHKAMQSSSYKMLSLHPETGKEMCVPYELTDKEFIGASTGRRLSRTNINGANVVFKPTCQHVLVRAEGINHTDFLAKLRDLGVRVSCSCEPVLPVAPLRPVQEAWITFTRNQTAPTDEQVSALDGLLINTFHDVTGPATSPTYGMIGGFTNRHPLLKQRDGTWPLVMGRVYDFRPMTASDVERVLQRALEAA